MWLLIITVLCIVVEISAHRSPQPSIFIIISVKTKRSVVKKCVASLLRHQSGRVKQRIIFVDDGSPKDTIAFENVLCKNHSAMFTCLKNRGKGYTHAIHFGIETALSQSTQPNDAIVLLNSDVIVTHDWSHTLYSELVKDNQTMLVGPVSNAATYQSIPQVNTGKGCCHWVTNPFPPGLDLDTVSYEVRLFAEQLELTRVPIIVLNGFCYMFKKSLIASIGSFDKVNFPLGYGEEVDFSLRAYQAGYKAYVVPSVYLYHEKTASFTESSKKTLKKNANPMLQVKYKTELKVANDLVRTTTKKQMEVFRQRMESVYESPLIKNLHNIHSFSVIFLYDMKSAQNDILKSQLYQIHALILIGVKVSIGLDQDAASSFRHALNGVNFDPRPLLRVVHFHPNTAADSEFLMSIKFNRMIFRHDIIIAHSCAIMSVLLKKHRSVAKHLIIYQTNDYNMQSVDQFTRTYHVDERTVWCSNIMVSENSPHLIVHADAYEEEIKTTHPKLSRSRAELTLDQNIYYMNDFDFTRRTHITLFFSAASYSLHATANYIVDVAHSLLSCEPPLHYHVSVAQFGGVGTETTFEEHFHLKDQSSAMLLKYNFLRESQQFSFFFGSDLRYGGLLRKTRVFVDLSHGSFAEQRWLEAIACGALVRTSTPSSKNALSVGYKSVCDRASSEVCSFDSFENADATVAGIARILQPANALDGKNDNDMRLHIIEITKQYKLEKNAAEWAVHMDKMFVDYRANHKSSSVSIVL